MTWAVYDSGTGLIYRIDNSEFAPEAESYVALAAPLAEWPTIPAGLVWQVVEGVPTYVDPRTLTQARLEKIAEITAARDSLVYATIDYFADVFVADAVSQGLIFAAIQTSANEPAAWTTPWTLANKSEVTLTKRELQELGRFIDARTTNLHSQAQVMYDANAIAGTTAEVNAILVQIYTDDVYYVAGVQTARPSLDSICSYTNVGGWDADGVNQILYGTALPNPTLVTVECDQANFVSPGVITVTDGGFELTTVLPGFYTITINAFPYKTKRIQEIAT